MPGVEGVPGLGAVMRGREPKKPDLASAARQFEGLLLQQMLRFAETPIAGPSLLDGGSAGRMYRSLFYEHVSEISARRGGFGIADLLVQQLAEREAGSGSDQEKP